MIAQRFLAAIALMMVVVAFPAESFAQSRAYDIAPLDAPTRSAVEQARGAAIRGSAAAARAFENGPGTISFRGTEGDRYHGEGYATNNESQRNGYGLLSWGDGEYYSGQTAAGRNSGLKQGYGVYAFVNGRLYEGEWSNDVRHGYGVQWTAEGQVFFAGRWENGSPVQ